MVAELLLAKGVRVNRRHLYICSFDCLVSKGLAHAGPLEGRPGMSDVFVFCIFLYWSEFLLF